MRYNLSCSVFELSHKKEPPLPIKNYTDIDASNRVFLRILHTSAQEENLELQYKVHPFQNLRLSSPEKLSEEKFDADIAVCMYPDLEHIGPELGHVLTNRRKMFRHVFIITQRQVPDSENDLWKAIKTLPQASINRGSILYEPIPQKVVDGDEIYDAEEGRLVSHWHVVDIRNKNARERIQTILAIA